MSNLRAKYFYDCICRKDNVFFSCDKEKFVRESDEIGLGQYRFNNPWDMESCTTPFQLVRNRTYYSPNGDPEWVYSFSRMEYLRKLIVAFYLTRDKKYLILHKNNVASFYSQNNKWKSRLQKSSRSYIVRGYRKVCRIIRESILSQPPIISTYRTLDTAIRNYSLLVDCCYLKASNCCDKYCTYLYKRVVNDLNFVIKDFNNFDEFSNWGLIKILLYTTCKIMIGCNDVHCEEEIILRLLNNQIKKDGGHIENSNMYHIQILICLLRFVYWCKLEGIPFTDEISSIAEKMTEYAYTLADPLGFQIMYGDSDYTCLDTILYIACNVLGIGKRLYKNKPDDTLLLMEFPTLIYCESSPVPSLKRTSGEFDSGVWYFNSDEYIVRAYNESSESGHKHADNGEIVLYYDRTPIITDLGRFSYHEEKRRQHYRGPWAHNIMYIDEGDEWEAKNNWSFKENPSGICNEVFTEGYKMQYTFASKGYTYRRYVIALNDVIIVVSCAKVQDNRQHDLKTVWNIVNGGSNCEKARFICDAGVSMYYNGEISISECKISKRYNEEEKSGVQAIITKSFCGVGFQIVCFSKKGVDIREKIHECILIMENEHVKLHFDPDSMILTWHIEKDIASQRRIGRK